MAKFKFRLQKLLDLRANELEKAKELYLLAKGRRLDAESTLAEIATSKTAVLRAEVKGIEERRSLDTYVQRLIDEERATEAAISVLLDEEETLKIAWHDAKKDHDALQKLFEADEAEWKLDADRKESAELDEWAVLRRSAA